MMKSTLFNKMFFIFFSIKRMDVQKLPKAPFYIFLALCDLPETSEKKFGKNFLYAGTVEENT